jgi:putative transposase
MIKPNARLPLSRQCELLSVSRSSLYYRPRPEDEQTLVLLRRLDELFTEHPM